MMFICNGWYDDAWMIWMHMIWYDDDFMIMQIDDKCMVYEMFRITNLYYARMGMNACGMINVFYMVLDALYSMLMVCGCKMDAMVMIYD